MNQDELIYEFDTALAILRVYQDFCEIEHKKKAMNLLVTNKYFAGKKKFYYCDLTSVQFREAGKITDGYLEFETAGTSSGNSGGAYTNENSFAFASVHSEQMRDIYNFIDAKIAECKRGARGGSNAGSSANDLLAYASLLEKGIISQEEFNQKKAELLSGTVQKSDAQSILEARRLEQENKEKERKMEEDRKKEARKAEEDRKKEEQEKARKVEEEQEKARKAEEEAKKAQKAINDEIKRQEKENIKRNWKATLESNKPLLIAYFVGLGCIYLASIILGTIMSKDVVSEIISVILFATFLHIPTTILAVATLLVNAHYGKIRNVLKIVTIILAILPIFVYGLVAVLSLFSPELNTGAGWGACATLMNILNLVIVCLIKKPKNME